MSAAKSLENAFQGQGRPRKSRDPKTKLPSHYQFANWAYDDGKRFAVPVGGVSKDKRHDYPLISTTIKNGSGTETLVWLTFDLDYQRADKKWRQDGKLSWPKIAETLQKETPELFKYFTGVTLSSGGKGLGLALSISPLELVDETGDIQKMAYRLQAWIICILNFYGMGADEGARGLKRLMPNLFQPDRVIDRDEVTEALVQKKRPRVIQILINALSNHRALRAPRKSEQSNLLWADIRVELPCARFYTDLLDSAGPWGTEQMRAREIIARYGMSKDSVYKILGNPPKWLGVERIEGEGYRLTIRPTREFTDRAYTLLETGGQGKAKGTFQSFASALISAPEDVVDGERNQWLVSLVLACKWKGLDRAELLMALKQLVKKVPGYQESRSLTRELQSIVRSLYHHRSGLIGSSPDLVLPIWLEDILNLNKSNRLSGIFPLKGPERSHSLARRSAEAQIEILSLSPDIKEASSFPRPEAPSAGVRGELTPSLVLDIDNFVAAQRSDPGKSSPNGTPHNLAGIQSPLRDLRLVRDACIN